MRAAVLALGLAVGAAASAVCIEVNDSSRSELLTPSAAEALEDCLAPSVRSDVEPNTWRFIQVQRGGRGGGGYRGGYSAYRPPPSSSMSRSFNRVAAPRPPVVRPPAARPPVARAPVVRMAPSAARLAPRSFARPMAPRGPSASISVRTSRVAGASIRAPGRAVSRAVAPRATPRVGVSRSVSATPARVAAPRAVAQRTFVRPAAALRVGQPTPRAVSRAVGANSRIAVQGSLARSGGARSTPPGPGFRPTGPTGSRAFAYASGRNSVIAATRAGIAGGVGRAAASSVRMNPDVRYAERALHNRLAAMVPANTNRPSGSGQAGQGRRSPALAPPVASRPSGPANSRPTRAANDNVPGDVAERQRTAARFYALARVNPEDRVSHMKGIDFNKPVEVRLLRAGEKVVQFVDTKKNYTGRYFAPLGTAGNTLGINIEGRVAKVYEVKRDVFVISSTAADTRNPTLGVPPNAQGPGGGLQYFSPSSEHFRPIE